MFFSTCRENHRESWSPGHAERENRSKRIMTGIVSFGFHGARNGYHVRLPEDKYQHSGQYEKRELIQGNLSAEEKPSYEDQCSKNSAAVYYNY